MTFAVAQSGAGRRSDGILIWPNWATNTLAGVEGQGRPDPLEKSVGTLVPNILVCRLIYERRGLQGRPGEYFVRDKTRCVAPVAIARNPLRGDRVLDNAKLKVAPTRH